jgi:hypothetical protein
VRRMTKLLDQAVAEIRKLSDAEQDRVASVMLGLIEFDVDALKLTPEQMAEVELARQEAREGIFASNEEMAELWRQFGL